MARLKPQPQPHAAAAARDVVALEARLDLVAQYLRYAIGKTVSFRPALLHAVAVVVLSTLAILSSDGAATRALHDEARAALGVDTAAVGGTSAANARTAGQLARWFADTALPTLAATRRNRTSQLLVDAFPIAAAVYRVDGSPPSCGTPGQIKAMGTAAVLRFQRLCEARRASATRRVRLWRLVDGPGAAPQTDGVEATVDLAAGAGNASRHFAATVAVDDDAGVDLYVPVFCSASRGTAVAHVAYLPSEGRTRVLTVRAGLDWQETVGALQLSLAAVLSAFSLCVAWEVVADAQLRWVILPGSGIRGAATLKGGFDIAYVLCSWASTAVTVAHFALAWRQGGPVEDPATAYTLLRDTARLTHVSRTLFVVWYLALCLRTLFYVRYWPRLSAISDTVVSAAPGVTGCLLLFGLLMAAFAAVGHLVFAPTVADFRTFGDALVFLCVVMCRGGSIDYGAYIDASPVAALSYFLLLHFFVQLIVLNVIIGVVASAFNAVVTSVDLVRSVKWSATTLRQDAVFFFRRWPSVWEAFLFPVATTLPAPTPRPAADPDADEELHSIAPPPKHEGPEGEGPPATDRAPRPSGGNYVTDRIAMLQDVERRMSLHGTGVVVTAADFDRLVIPGRTADEQRQVVGRVLHKASLQIGNSDGVDRQFKVSLEESRRAQRVDGNFWTQAGLVHDVHAAICSEQCGGFEDRAKVTHAAAVQALVSQQDHDQEKLTLAMDKVSGRSDALADAAASFQQEVTALVKGVAEASELCAETEAVLGLVQ